MMEATTDKELMMRNEMRVIADMKGLLAHDSADGLRWHGTRTDLIEMVHILYESCEIRDEDGLPIAFNRLVERCCRVLGEKVPRNPCTYLSHARQCQGVKRAPLLLRYKGGMVGY